MSLLASSVVCILQKAGRSIPLWKLAESLDVEPKFLHEKLKADPRVRVAMTRAKKLDQAKVVLK